MRQNVTTSVADHVELVQRNGRLRASIKEWQSLLPLWAYRQLFRYDPKSVAIGFPLFDIEVVRTGVVRVSGIWAGPRGSVVISQWALMFLTSPGATYPLSIEGMGEATVLNVQGPGVLFGLQGAAVKLKPSG